MTGYTPPPRTHIKRSSRQTGAVLFVGRRFVDTVLTIYWAIALACFLIVLVGIFLILGGRS